MFEAQRLAESLHDRFALPSGAGRGRPSRQQTLRAMIDIAEELARWTEVVELLCQLGQRALADGRTAQARQCFERALQISTERSHHCGELQARKHLGEGAPVALQPCPMWTQPLTAW
ncbi:hypothetical protein ABT324_20490 [Saccharopolyspora sp. NPDC000359]|uniref:hypothetical protein n=1 Tax=Saccharopolyspora sp. NPDC000359 TaxID=3154251 RepID=UPI00331FBCF3